METILIPGLTEVEQKIVCGVFAPHQAALQEIYDKFLEEEFVKKGLPKPAEKETKWSDRKNRDLDESKVMLSCHI